MLYDKYKMKWFGLEVLVAFYVIASMRSFSNGQDQSDKQTPLSSIIQIHLLSSQKYSFWCKHAMKVCVHVKAHVIVLCCSQLSCLKWSFSRYSRGMSCSSSLPLRCNRSKQLYTHDWDICLDSFFFSSGQKLKHYYFPQQLSIIEYWTKQ